MQQQIQSLELAVLQGRAQGADELISAPGRPGSGRAWNNIDFLIKIIKKTIDFERQDGRPGRALGAHSGTILVKEP